MKIANILAVAVVMTAFAIPATQAGEVQESLEDDFGEYGWWKYNLCPSASEEMRVVYVVTNTGTKDPSGMPEYKVTRLIPECSPTGQNQVSSIAQ